jgi:hypothetical protein
MPATRNFFLHNTSTSVKTVNLCEDSKRGDFRMETKERIMLLRMDNFLFDRETVEVHCRIGGGWQEI